MGIKISLCPRCGTMNEEAYSFCKNCGASLKGGYANSYTNNSGNPYNQWGFGARNADYQSFAPTICGTDTAKLEAYIGPEKRDYYIPRFIAMDKSGKRASVNWAVLLLGILNPMLAAAWFFYRRLYKWGLCLCGISIIITAVFTLLTFQESKELYSILVDALKAGGELNLQAELNALPASEASLRTELINIASTLISAALAFSAGFFANWLYMKDCCRRVNALPVTAVSPFALQSQGAPSIASAILLFILFRVIELFIAMAPLWAAMGLF